MEIMKKSSNVELDATSKNELKRSKNGGIFPAKKRLVKKMMLDRILHKLFSVFLCSSFEIAAEPKASMAKKTKIFQHQNKE